MLPVFQNYNNKLKLKESFLSDIFDNDVRVPIMMHFDVNEKMILSQVACQESAAYHQNL